MHVGIPFRGEIRCITNEGLSTNVKVDGSCVRVNLVDKIVPMVDQVLLQIPEPETVKLFSRK